MKICAIKRYILFALIVIINTFYTNSQVTRIKGRVRDAETGEPIPYVSIFIKGTSVATITNDSGAYQLNFRIKADSLSASFLGYKSKTEIFSRHTSQIIDFNLYSNTTKMEEVIVIPGENPAHKILNQIWKHKELNNPKAHNLQCSIYNKIQISLSNIDEKFRNKKLLKPFKFVFDNVDTNAFTGKTYLPILISETASEYYYQKNPEIEKENVIANQISGIKNESVMEFIGGLNQNLDIYNDFMTFYSETGFISPIADAGLLFYRYYLLDIAEKDGHKRYHLSFKPRRKQERTFTGEFWVADSTFAVISMSMRINPEANLNFISDLSADYEYTALNDSVWVLKREHLQTDLSLVDSKYIKGLQGDRTIIYSDYKLNEPIPTEIAKNEEKLIHSDSTVSEDYWKKNRPIQLTKKDEKIYKMVDSIKNVPAFRTAYDILSTLFDAHYNFGKFKIGPYFSLYSFNKVEGHRFRIGGTTTAKFSENIKLTGYVAYGTTDKEIKYYGNVIYVVRSSPRTTINTTYKHDVTQLNIPSDDNLNENIISSVLRRNEFTKLQMINNFNTTFETDLISGITSTLSFNFRRIFKSAYIPIQLASDSSQLPFINSSEVALNLHFESGQKFFRSKFKRVRLRNNNPAFDIKVTKSLKNILGCKFNYWKINVTMKHFLQTNPIGFNRYSIEAGKIFGNAAWPLLSVMNGNETYGLRKDAFNMMNYYEFVADEFVSFNTEQHFQGFFLNYIPLLRKLRLREVATFKVVTGRINKKNTDEIMLPEFMQSLNKPYMEAGVGVENIFKVLRIDVLWRLTHVHNKDVQIFGLRARFQFML